MILPNPLQIRNCKENFAIDTSRRALQKLSSSGLLFSYLIRVCGISVHNESDWFSRQSQQGPRIGNGGTLPITYHQLIMLLKGSR